MITASTTNPNALLSAIKKAIDDGRITTWSYDTDGDFTHTPEQWKGKAWLRPSPSNGALLLGILGQKDTPLKAEYYAVYHGRFIEMLAAHFDTLFSAASATAKPQPPDQVAAKA